MRNSFVRNKNDRTVVRFKPFQVDKTEILFKTPKADNTQILHLHITLDERCQNLEN